MEFELRTRLYWLVYGADKSMACLGDLPMQIRSLEYGVSAQHVSLPLFFPVTFAMMAMANPRFPFS